MARPSQILLADQGLPVAGSGLIVLLISGVSSTHEFDISFAERLLETALGAGLALTFGVAIRPGCDG